MEPKAAHRIRRLIATAEEEASASFDTLRDAFPVFHRLAETAGKERWMFFATVAGIAAGVGPLMVEIERRHDARLFGALVEEVFAWDRRANGTLQNLNDFVAMNRYLGEDNYRTVVGLWVLLHIEGVPPSQEEKAIAGEIGERLTNAVRDRMSLS
jgi:hypothetical protein